MKPSAIAIGKNNSGVEHKTEFGRGLVRGGKHTRLVCEFGQNGLHRKKNRMITWESRTVGDGSHGVGKQRAALFGEEMQFVRLPFETGQQEGTSPLIKVK
ncbi:hypothetical protein M5K25_018138 [Dendrobium thyrsiflorum]|uniref:Ribosomal protein L2 n=1 Tax=Dendrobium thyrsiflorum TaxID=117978 RepID=A0ABD0UHG8_DENTH